MDVNKFCDSLSIVQMEVEKAFFAQGLISNSHFRPSLSKHLLTFLALHFLTTMHEVKIK